MGIVHDTFVFLKAAKQKDHPSCYLRWSSCYCLTARCDGLSISKWSSQSFSFGGLCLLLFLVNANLMFLQSSSALSLDFLSAHRYVVTLDQSLKLAIVLLDDLEQRLKTAFCSNE
jgi:hypothetical protein